MRPPWTFRQRALYHLIIIDQAKDDLDNRIIFDIVK